MVTNRIAVFTVLFTVSSTGVMVAVKQKPGITVKLMHADRRRGNIHVGDMRDSTHATLNISRATREHMKKISIKAANQFGAKEAQMSKRQRKKAIEKRQRGILIAQARQQAVIEKAKADALRYQEEERRQQAEKRKSALDALAAQASHHLARRERAAKKDAAKALSEMQVKK